MNNLTAEVARMDIGHLKSFQANPHVGLSLKEEKYLQALEIALPVLEQQERGELVRVAFTGSGSLEAIKRGEEGFIWGSKADAHPIEIFVHRKDAVCAKCNGTGEMDSGGTQPWGEQILVECDCQFEQQEKEQKSPNHAQCCAEAGGDVSICDCVNKDWVYLPKTSTTPQIDNDGWVDWGGGEMPTSSDCFVEVKFRDVDCQMAQEAFDFDWHHYGNASDIIAYRVIENDGREG